MLTSPALPAFRGLADLTLTSLNQPKATFFILDRHVDNAGASLQRPGKAELVTIGIGQVEEPLAPFGIAGRRLWAIAGRNHSRMEGVNVGAVEDHASPPGPLALGRLRDEIEIARSRPKARECCVQPP